MEKAYDPKALIEEVRKEGGPDAEKLLKKNWTAIKNWLAKSAAMSENKYDDVAVPLGIATLDGFVSKAIDQVDGIEGN